MMRRIAAAAAVSVAVGAVIYGATRSPARPPRSSNAPVSTFRPFIQWGDSIGDKIAITPQAGVWSQRVHGPLHLRYSWLKCDMQGSNCSPLPGLHTQSIAPPQEPRIVTLRGVVTATNRFGSTSATTSDFRYDEAGFPIKYRKDLRPFFYSPAQLRDWYGLRPAQDGAGQTIVITAFWRAPELPAAVDHFSSHYGLPLVCGTAHAGPHCFKLADFTFGHPKYVAPGEDEDIEWAHAIAPRARIVVVRSRSLPQLLRQAGYEERAANAHVVSASWSSPRRWPALYGAVATACHARQVVCTFPSGDYGAPGDRPSNSPYVLAVGGSVFRSRGDGSPAAEARWPHSGYGATNEFLPRPIWQRNLAGCRGFKDKTTSGLVLHIRDPECDYRTVPDVAATADGVLEYQIPAKRHKTPGWFFGGGTSLSSPLWAGLIAVSDQELARRGQAPIGIDELHAVLDRGWVSGGLRDLGDRGWDKRNGWGSAKAGIVDVLAHAIERYRHEG